MLIIDCISNEEGPSDFKSVLDGHLTGYASFIENRHQYLTIQYILKSDFVYDGMQCALNCLIRVRCRSFNLNLQAVYHGKHLCELLTLDKSHHSNHCEPRVEYHYYWQYLGEIFNFALPCCWLSMGLIVPLANFYFLKSLLTPVKRVSLINFRKQTGAYTFLIRFFVGFLQ